MSLNIGEPKFKLGDIVSRTTNYLPEFMGRVAGVETVYGRVSGVDRVYKVEGIDDHSSGPAVRSISESQLKLYAKFIPPLFKVKDVVKHVYNGDVGRVDQVVIQKYGGEPYYILRDIDDQSSGPVVGLIRQDQLRKHKIEGGYKKRSKSSKSKTKKRRRKGRKTRRHRRKHKQKNA